MKITNRTMVEWLNRICRYAEIEKSLNSSILNAKGTYAVLHNKKVLLSQYEPYTDTLKTIPTDDEVAIGDLLAIEIEIPDIKTIGAEDFRDGVTFEVMTLLEFMTM